jgi:diguanylate cyclase
MGGNHTQRGLKTVHPPADSPKVSSRTDFWRHTTRSLRACLYVNVFGAFTYLATLIARGGEGGQIVALDFWLYNCLNMFASLLVCFYGKDWVWRFLGVAMTLPVLGEFIVELGYGGYESLPFPSLVDVFFTAYYPVTMVAIVVLLRRQVRGVLTKSITFDAVICALTATAYLLWLALSEILASANGSAFERFVSLLPPVFDGLLVSLVVIAVALLGRRLPIYWWALLSGLVIQSAVDVRYYLLIARDSYVEGTYADAAWPFACVLMVVAMALGRTPTTPATRSRSWLQLATASTMGMLSLILLGIDRYVAEIPESSFAIAMIAITAVGGRAVWSYRDVHRLAETRQAANTDELTGLGNRRTLSEALDGLRRQSTPFALMIIDLDRFKAVNDSLGHASGDRVLCEVADRLTDVLGNRAQAIRLSGDEFAIVTKHIRQADAIAQEVHTALCAPYLLEGLDVHLGASIGIASWPRDCEAFDDTPTLSDHAMYRVKAEGGGVARFDPTVDQPDQGRLLLVEELRNGLVNGELVPWFQPQYSLKTGAVVGFEALARWNHPTRGIVQPSVTIPLAVQSGMLHGLTIRMLSESLRCIAEWRQNYGDQITVSVNVSAVSLASAEFPSLVASLLKRHGLPGSALVLEITEDTAISDRVRSLGTLKTLQELGISISLDDYGTGYSSLSYLKDLHLTEIKLDRSFISQLHDPVTLAIVKSTTLLAIELGLTLVSEGIEDLATLAALQNLGCASGQGFLWSPAVPESQAPALLQRQGASLPVS